MVRRNSRKLGRRALSLYFQMHLQFSDLDEAACEPSSTVATCPWPGLRARPELPCLRSSFLRLATGILVGYICGYIYVYILVHRYVYTNLYLSIYIY